MWRISVISIFAVPVAMLLSFVVYPLMINSSKMLPAIAFDGSLNVCAIVYIAGRVVLLVLLGPFPLTHTRRFDGLPSYHMYSSIIYNMDMMCRSYSSF